MISSSLPLLWFGRYNESDQPVCRVCDVVLKSDSHWDAHRASRKHHEVIIYIVAVDLNSQIQLRILKAVPVGGKITIHRKLNIVEEVWQLVEIFLEAYFATFQSPELSA